jgi:hypothetical protein
LASKKRTRLEKGKLFSEGCRLLWLALRKRGVNVAQARIAVGCKYEGTLDRVLYGDRKPGLQLVLAIQKQFEVPAAAWTIPPKKSFELPEALRVAS